MSKIREPEAQLIGGSSIVAFKTVETMTHHLNREVTSVYNELRSACKALLRVKETGEN
jgi:hypothetical protein